MFLLSEKMSEMQNVWLFVLMCFFWALVVRLWDYFIRSRIIKCYFLCLKNKPIKTMV